MTVITLTGSSVKDNSYLVWHTGHSGSNFCLEKLQAPVGYSSDLVVSGTNNYIINGNFDFWQRDTSLACTNTIAYKCDRWWTFVNDNAVTVAQIASTDSNSTYAARI